METESSFTPSAEAYCSAVFEIARIYQQETGIGLPFSSQDEETMLAALRKSFREQTAMLREHQRRDYITRQFIAEAYPQNDKAEP